MQNRDEDFIERAKQSQGDAEKMMDLRAEYAKNVQQEQMARRPHHRKDAPVGAGTRHDENQLLEDRQTEHYPESIWESTKETIQGVVDSARETVSEIWEDIAYPDGRNEE